MRLLQLGLILTSLALGSAGAAHPASAQYVLEYDHATRTARLLAPDAKPARVHGVVELPAGKTVVIRIVNTNTAIYTFSTEAKSQPTPERDLLSAFAGKMGPYLPELGVAMAGGTPAVARGETPSMLPRALDPDAPDAVRVAYTSGQQTEQAMLALDQKIHGSHGIRTVETRAYEALERMRQGGSVDTISHALADSLGLPTPPCPADTGHRSTRKLALTSDLVTTLLALVATKADLDRSLSEVDVMAAQGIGTSATWQPVRDSLAVLTQRAEAAATDYDKIVAAAYRAENLALAVTQACSVWQSAPIRVAGGSQQSVSVAIHARSEPELARVADRGDETYTATLQPHSFARISVGALILVAPSATFPSYSTEAASSGMVQIFKNAVHDSRFNWGFNAGLGWPVPGAHAARSVALWFPELSINPSNGVSLLALGGGISWHIVKIGAGVAWIRHTVLDGQAVNDTIPTNGLKTRDTYNDGKFYVSLTVFDVPPFVFK